MLAPAGYSQTKLQGGLLLKTFCNLNLDFEKFNNDNETNYDNYTNYYNQTN